MTPPDRDLDGRDVEKRTAKVLKRLDRVIDPHTNVSVLKMNLVTGVELTPDGKGYRIKVNFRPDTPACPVIEEIKTDITRSVGRLRWVTSVEVVVTVPEEGCQDG